MSYFEKYNKKIKFHCRNQVQVVPFYKKNYHVFDGVHGCQHNFVNSMNTFLCNL